MPKSILLRIRSVTVMRHAGITVRMEWYVVRVLHDILCTPCYTIPRGVNSSLRKPERE